MSLTKGHSFALTQRSRSFYSVSKDNLIETVSKLFRIHDARCSVLVAIDTEEVRRSEPLRTTLAGLYSQIHAIVSLMNDGDWLSIIKDGYAADDLMAMLHRVDWRVIGQRMRTRNDAEQNAEEHSALCRAVNVLTRVIEGTAVPEQEVSDTKSQKNDQYRQYRALRNARFLALHRELERSDRLREYIEIDSEDRAALLNQDERFCAPEFMIDERFRAHGLFSVPVPPHLIPDLLYRASDWIERVGRWSPTSFVYWIESKEHQLYELTPYGITDATLFHIDLDDGFSAPFGRAAPVGKADPLVPRHLREAFETFKAGLSASVLTPLR